MSDGAIDHVSDTAFLVARLRALEAERPDPLFLDPLAARLSGERGKKIVENLPGGAEFAYWSIVIRTCIIDELISDSIAQGIGTVLNLGAGLDTRPYRLKVPETLRWIEVDYPELIRFKESALSGEKPTCRLERVKLDLADSSARREFLAQQAAPGHPTLVLTEGVIPYLSQEEAGALADDLSSHGAFRYWISDYYSPEYRHRRSQAMKRTLRKSPFRFEHPSYLEFFRQHGWEAGEARYFAEEGQRLGRPPPFSWRMRAGIQLRRFFASAEKREAMRRFAGFIRFERARAGGS